MNEKWNIEGLPSQQGKIAIVTGANSGLGYETALALAGKDMEVVLACRDLQKAKEAAFQIRSHYPAAKVRSMYLELNSLRSIKKFAGDFKKTYQSIDLLINNAGIMMAPFELTENGFENHLATNYLGHFALTGLLLPLLTATNGSRVVTLSSLSYKWAEIDFDDIHARKRYSRRKAYGQSKRACLVFAFELQRRLQAAGCQTISLAAHPGLSKTNLDRYFPPLIRPLGNLFLQRASKGALNTLFASLAGSIKGGEFVGPDGFRQMRGYPTLVEADAHSKNKTIAERLWRVSEEMTGVRYLSEKTSSTGL